MINHLSSVRTVVLDQVVLYSEERVSAELVGHVSTSEWRKLEYSYELARRHLLRMFGKSATVELTCPATWWEHVKLALRTRWPKLFERLRIKLRTETASVGAVMTGLPPASAKHRVVPYMLEPYGRDSLTGGTVRDNERPWEPSRESLERYVREIATDRYRAGRQRVEEVVVHPDDFLDFCRESERRHYYEHVGDRQVIHTAAGDVRIAIEPRQTPGVVGIP